MKTTANYLDELVQKTGAKSDGACGLMLGWTRAATSNYRHCKNAFDNHTCLIVARTLGIPLEQVIADMELQREKDEKKKADWLSFELRLKGAAATFVLASIVTMLLHPSPASASNQPLMTADFDNLQIIRRRRVTIRAAIAAALYRLDMLFRRVCCVCSPNACITV